MGATQAGVILGTAAYLAPEQARGKPVDKRADIWAYGVVLYEMLAGQQLFEGETVTDILAAVVTKEPDWNKVPARMQPLLRWCLEKEPKRRLRDIGDVHRLMEEEAPEAALTVEKNNRLWPAVAATLVAALALVSFIHFGEQPRKPETPVRFRIAAPQKTTRSSLISMSPDGRKLAFLAGGLWAHFLETGESRRLTAANGSPFWSPDSRFIAFADDGKLNQKGSMLPEDRQKPYAT